LAIAEQSEEKVDRTAFHKSLTGSPVASPELVTPNIRLRGNPVIKKERFMFQIPFCF
jgi:hypothetical protein